LQALPGALPTILYAGNLGEGQGLHAILPHLARRMESVARFRIIGDGGRRRLLEERIAAAGVLNVEMLAPMSRDTLIEEYRRADVLFLHLNDYPAFEKVLPSKIFEYAAMGKPVWAGVAGYAEDFIHSEVENAAVFRPGDVDGALLAFERLRIAPTPRPAFVAKFARARISEAMARDLLAVAAANER
jgi:glycosyltransferase involved in cell wall biosynthesis